MVHKYQRVRITNLDIKKFTKTRIKICLQVMNRERDKVYQELTMNNMFNISRSFVNG